MGKAEPSLRSPRNGTQVTPVLSLDGVTQQQAQQSGRRLLGFLYDDSLQEEGRLKTCLQPVRGDHPEQGQKRLGQACCGLCVDRASWGHGGALRFCIF